MTPLTWLRCHLLGDCDEEPPGLTTVQETRRLMKAVDEAMVPVQERIDAEVKQRPELAAALRRAQRQHREGFSR